MADNDDILDLPVMDYSTDPGPDPGPESGVSGVTIEFRDTEEQYQFRMRREAAWLGMLYQGKRWKYDPTIDNFVPQGERDGSTQS